MSYKIAWALMFALMLGMVLIAYAAHNLKGWAGWLGAAVIVSVLVAVWFL